MSGIVEELRTSLNNTTSLPFLFIGSGFSRRYLDLPDWRGLMGKFAEDAHPEGSEFAYQFYKNRIDGETLLADELLPLMAREIEKDYTVKFLTDARYQESREKYKELIHDDVSCLKIGITEFFRECEFKFDSPSYQDEVIALKEIKNKVAGVITTNYDTFIEYIFDNFETYIGQDQLLFSQIYEMAEIYKIHGCCSDPASLTITHDDFKVYNKKNAYLSAKLLTIFLEHPVIFVGYSLNDPNIKSILSDIVQCLNDAQLKQLAKRLFFVLRASESRPENTIIREKEFDGRALEVTEIIRNDFSEIYNTIGKARPKYEPKILRSLKKDIYELVTSNDPKGRLHVLNIDDTENMSKVDYVLGVGAWQQMGDEGYVSLEPYHLFEDLLYDNQKYDHKKIVFKVLPKLLKTHSNSIPVFKYVTDVKEEDMPEKVKEYIHGFSSYKSHLNETIRKRPALTVHSIIDIKSGYNLADAKGAQKCLDDVVKLKEEEIIAEELHDLLKEIYEFHPGMFHKETKQTFKSNFRKAMKIYDWVVYCEDKK